VRNNVPLDFNHFCERSDQFGSLQKDELTKNTFKELLKEKIGKISIDMVKRDVRPFIRNQEELDIWSTDYFIQLVDMIKFE
jgi:hypothetical protein